MTHPTPHVYCPLLWTEQVPDLKSNLTKEVPEGSHAPVVGSRVVAGLHEVLHIYHMPRKRLKKHIAALKFVALYPTVIAHLSDNLAAFVDLVIDLVPPRTVP